MTPSRDPEELVRAFFDEGPTELSDRAVEAVLSEIHRTHQRAAFGSWRTLTMSRAAFAAMAIVAAVSMSALALWATRNTAPSIAAPPTSLLPSPVTSPSRPAESALPSASATTAGTILYGRRDAASGDDFLYAIAPDGTAGRQLDPKHSCCLTISPDGVNLVYGLVSANGAVVPAARVLPNGNSSQFDSPANLNLAPRAVSSGLDIAFEGWDGKDLTRTGVYVSIDNGGGLIWGTLKRLTTNRGSRDVPLAFSPDGSNLLFERRMPGSEYGDLYLIHPDGSGLRRLNAESTSVRDDDLFGSGASWSPDSKHVAFSGFDPAASGCQTTGVFVVDLVAGTTPAVAHPTGCTTSARWSPDGNWIAFDDSTNAGGSADVWLVHPDGSGLINLTLSLSVGVCCGQWSADSSHLVIQGGAAERSEVDLWVVNADGAGGTQLTSEPSLYKWYVWSPTQ